MSRLVGAKICTVEHLSLERCGTGTSGAVSRVAGAGWRGSVRSYPRQSPHPARRPELTALPPNLQPDSVMSPRALEVIEGDPVGRGYLGIGGEFRAGGHGRTRRGERRSGGVPGSEGPRRRACPPDDPDRARRLALHRSREWLWPTDRRRSLPGGLRGEPYGHPRDLRYAPRGESGGCCRGRGPARWKRRPKVALHRRLRREGGGPDARAGGRAGGSVRVRLAPTSATTARRRAKATVIRLPATRGRTGREGQKPLELRSGAAGAGDLLIASNQVLELSATSGAAVLVDGHGRSFAGGRSAVKGSDDPHRWPAESSRRRLIVGLRATRRLSPPVGSSRGRSRSTLFRFRVAPKVHAPGTISGARRASRESSRKPCQAEEWWPARGERRRRCGLPPRPGAIGWSLPSLRPSATRLR